MHEKSNKVNLDTFLKKSNYYYEGMLIRGQKHRITLPAEFFFSRSNFSFNFPQNGRLLMSKQNKALTYK